MAVILYFKYSILCLCILCVIIIIVIVGFRLKMYNSTLLWDIISMM